MRFLCVSILLAAAHLPAASFAAGEYDLVIANGLFDPDAIHDVATYEDPNRLSVGMQYVLVNGVPSSSGAK